MKISTRGRYATCVLIELAEEYGKAPVSLKSICDEQKISIKYLENIMRLFIPHGILKGIKGKNGGFVLAKHPKDIKMGEIVAIAEKVVMPIHCIADSSKCPRALTCPAKYVWHDLQSSINHSLDSKTLNDLVKLKAKLGSEVKRGAKAKK